MVVSVPIYKIVRTLDDRDTYVEMHRWLLANKIPFSLEGEQYEVRGWYPEIIKLQEEDAVVFRLRFGV